MVPRDRRGRRRQPGQERGLRPLYPPLDAGWQSRALRVAMPAGLWRAFDNLVRCFPSSTLARSQGEAMSYLIRREERGAALWLDWEQQKHLRLLRHSAGGRG